MKQRLVGRIKHSLTVISLLLVLAGVVKIAVNPYLPLQTRHASRIAAARKWTRMAPIPDAAEYISANKEGSPFTAKYIIRFKLSKADFEQWLATSPGTKDLTSCEATPSGCTYRIKPGGGAQFAVVYFVEMPDSLSSFDRIYLVTMRTYWS